jgi:hypothetical protein
MKQVAQARKELAHLELSRDSSFLAGGTRFADFPLPQTKASTCNQTFPAHFDIVVYWILDSLAKLARECAVIGHRRRRHLRADRASDFQKRELIEIGIRGHEIVSQRRRHNMAIWPVS